MVDNEFSDTPNADAVEELLRERRSIRGGSEPIDEETRIRVELVSLFNLAEQIRLEATQKNIPISPNPASGIPDPIDEKFGLSVLKPPRVVDLKLVLNQLLLN